MTLNEIIKNQESRCMFEGFCYFCTKQACLEYARSIVPEEKENASSLEPADDWSYWNACRTQILSRIEEDSK